MNHESHIPPAEGSPNDYEYATDKQLTNVYYEVESLFDVAGDNARSSLEVEVYGHKDGIPVLDAQPHIVLAEVKGTSLLEADRDISNAAKRLGVEPGDLVNISYESPSYFAGAEGKQYYAAAHAGFGIEKPDSQAAFMYGVEVDTRPGHKVVEGLRSSTGDMPEVYVTDKERRDLDSALGAIALGVDEEMIRLAYQDMAPDTDDDADVMAVAAMRMMRDVVDGIQAGEADDLAKVLGYVRAQYDKTA